VIDVRARCVVGALLRVNRHMARVEEAAFPLAELLNRLDNVVGADNNDLMAFIVYCRVVLIDHSDKKVVAP
jgi:hypothetical protein